MGRLEDNNRFVNNKYKPTRASLRSVRSETDASANVGLNGVLQGQCYWPLNPSTSPPDVALMDYRRFLFAATPRERCIASSTERKRRN